MSSTFERDEASTPAGSDKFLSKIRKLLAKASAEGCTDAERDMLNAKAAELCAKYGIDRARAANAGTNGDEIALSPYCFYDATHAAQAELMYYIAEALGCQAILIKSEADPNFESTGLTVIGYLSDVERAEMFFESLYLQMISGAIKFAARDRKSFMRGFSVEIGDRIKAAENQARAEEAPAGSSTALVLASREVAVRKAFTDEFPHRSYGRSGSLSVNGYAAGRAAAKAANLGGRSVGGQRAAIAS
jgi:Protein of unknown function (DUF2786)